MRDVIFPPHADPKHVIATYHAPVGMTAPPSKILRLEDGAQIGVFPGALQRVEHRQNTRESYLVAVYEDGTEERFEGARVTPFGERELRHAGCRSLRAGR